MVLLTFVLVSRAPALELLSSAECGNRGAAKLSLGGSGVPRVVLAGVHSETAA